MSIAPLSGGIDYAGGVRGIGLLGVWLSLPFGIRVLLAQLIPAEVLLSSVIGASFSSFRKAELPIQVS